MPNRFIRDSICTSDTLASLSAEGERFFYRLLVNVDDYGIYDARLSVLRAHCFSVMLDRVDEDDVAVWLDECLRAGLIRLYEVDRRPYLQVVTMTKYNKPRAEASRYPPPPDTPTSAPQAPANKREQVQAPANNGEQTQTDAAYSYSYSDAYSRSQEETHAPEPAPAVPAPSPEKPEKEKKTRAPNENYELAAAMGEVCGIEIAANKGRLLKEASQLRAASPPPTPEEVRLRYGHPAGWWWANDWRGQKGEYPSPATLRETWGRWLRPTPTPPRRNTHATIGLASPGSTPEPEDAAAIAAARERYARRGQQPAGAAA